MLGSSAFRTTALPLTVNLTVVVIVPATSSLSSVLTAASPAAPPTKTLRMAEDGIELGAVSVLDL
jgi:hypothetical protein